MKTIVLAIVAAVVVGLVAGFVLDRQQRPAYQAYVGSGASVGEPGDNLVGKNWNGMNAGGNVGHGGHGAKS